MFGPKIFTSVINTYLPEPHASLLNGILFGINIHTSSNFYEQLKIVGLLHIVVLSGTNITLLANIIGSITSFAGKRVSVLITILSIILFIFFVGPQAPIVRAGIMGILTLVAILYGRKSTAFYSLFLSAFIIALIKPQWFSSISFQLSYGASLGLILFGKSSESESKTMKDKVINYICKDLRTSFSAQVFTAPIIFIYFKQVSFISLISNLLVSWLIAPLMVLGFLTSVLGKIHYLLGLLPAYLCYGLLSYMIAVIEILAKIPFAYVKF